MSRTHIVDGTPVVAIYEQLAQECPGEVRLNLCCGQYPLEGWINVDIEPGPGITQVDLNKLPWPWADDSVDAIASDNGFEHLAPLGVAQAQANIIALMRETHRVLKPGGIALIVVPSTEGPGAFQDPTHVTYWNNQTFEYFVEGFANHDVYHKTFPGFAIGLDPDGVKTGMGRWANKDGTVFSIARMRKP